MRCEQTADRLGAYLDGELASAEQAGVAAHLAECPACARELAELKALATGLSEVGPVDVPAKLWSRIERALDHADATKPRLDRRAGRWLRRRPLSMAAAIVFLVTIGSVLFSGPDTGGGQAQASTVDFGMLLRDLSFNPKKAIRRFLVRYRGEAITPRAAKRFAPDLNFELPAELPGGYGLAAVYGLRFGGAPGIAAQYARNGDVVVVVFHPPVGREDFGTYRDYPCMIGKHRGHKVSVGDWNLVHLTDPTTCHCILSRIREDAALSPVLAAVAPCEDCPCSQPSG